MGGGSSVMGMVAYRGTPDDYHEWEALGATGWGWNDVLPFYRKLENEMDFGGELHGKDGPVPIRRTKPEDWAPLSKAVHVYAQERQIPFIADMNADFRDGYGAVPMSNWPHKRASAAICYLDAAVRARRNLTIINGATATGFVLEGRRVTDVIVRIGGEEKRFGAREIILALGGIHSPAFLMRAGIGPAAHLRELGIDVRHDLPGVGRNLSNHAIVFVGLLQKPDARQAELVAAAPDDGVPLFVRPARRAAVRHVHQRAVQDLVVAARPPGRQSGAHAAQAEGARPRHPDRARRAGRRASSSTSPATSSTCNGSCRASAGRSRSWRTRRCAR